MNFPENPACFDEAVSKPAAPLPEVDRTCGEALVTLLEGYGVEYVFGIPGVHTVELYRGIAESSLKHVTPRHEQASWPTVMQG